MSTGDYASGYWINGVWYPYYPTYGTTTVWPYPLTYTVQPVAQGWQCPGCKTYYSPAEPSCRCAVPEPDPETAAE